MIIESQLGESLASPCPPDSAVQPSRFWLPLWIFLPDCAHALIIKEPSPPKPANLANSLLGWPFMMDGALASDSPWRWCAIKENYCVRAIKTKIKLQKYESKFAYTKKKVHLHLDNATTSSGWVSGGLSDFRLYCLNVRKKYLNSFWTSSMILFRYWFWYCHVFKKDISHTII